MSEKIENLLGEDRTFDPPSSIVENANATQEWFDLPNEARLASVSYTHLTLPTKA